ncbi:hypothetical protein HK097_002506, partial [Rhizophlyctis rosea]
MNTLRNAVSIHNLRKAASSLSLRLGITSEPAEEDFPKDVPFTDDPCRLCANPCDENHPQLPEYLQKKIDDGPLHNSMKPYARHILVVFGSSAKWAERLEDETDSYLDIAHRGASASKSLNKRTLVSAADPMPELQPTSPTPTTTEESTEPRTSTSSNEASTQTDSTDTVDLYLFPEALLIPSVPKHLLHDTAKSLSLIGAPPP